MDSITHTLFGLALYGTVNKTDMSRRQKAALLFTTVVGSQIPDMDVISQFWDTTGRYQMWHRGISHSLLMVPVWAAFIALFVRLVFKEKGWRWFNMSLLAVFIHDTSDTFNAWGTGYFEPLSSARLTLGTIPIVDVVFWMIMLGGYWTARIIKKRYHRSPHQIYRIVWALMIVHAAAQTGQGMALLHETKDQYDQSVLAADFIPGVFTVVGKKDGIVTLQKGSIWTGLAPIAELESKEDSDLEVLFEQNPKARTLVEWSPFVVIVDDGTKLGVFDPRFYRKGASFLYEYIDIN
ncbi:metal-dependent hydrolase [Paenibacillus sp. GCM10012307]|uniref:Metal-dependent hydrolase n=1 Tax=Paenibacillus roseus TaxID=2798579 RepID=A0A934IV90_9BACL|nr:metal-dependent hydrolase [Paenibacillus roseus]MBJ6359956.1 metal-dependent hydrolase [Paenibacillus roseus]